MDRNKSSLPKSSTYIYILEKERNESIGAYF